MSVRTVGWLWVAGQVVLLGALVLLPGGDDWSAPTWLDVTASLTFFAGLAIVVVGALGLGQSLTPTPVPTSAGSLATGGMFRWVRHPIYTGVLLVVAGMVVPSGNWWQLAVGAATFGFFDRKAAWEERQLALHYPGYAAYAARTPKFIPRPWR